MKKKFLIVLTCLAVVISGAVGVEKNRRERLTAERKSEVQQELRALIPSETERFYAHKEHFEIVAYKLREIADPSPSYARLFSYPDGMLLTIWDGNSTIDVRNEEVNKQFGEEFYNSICFLQENKYSYITTFNGTLYNTDKMEIRIPVCRVSSEITQTRWAWGFLTLVKSFSDYPDDGLHVPLGDGWYFTIEVSVGAPWSY